MIWIRQPLVYYGNDTIRPDIAMMMAFTLQFLPVYN